MSSATPPHILVYEILAILTRRDVAVQYPIAQGKTPIPQTPEELELVYVVRWVYEADGTEQIFTFGIDAVDMASGCVLYDSPEGIMMRL